MMCVKYRNSCRDQFKILQILTFPCGRVYIHTQQFIQLMYQECRLPGCYALWLLEGPPKRVTSKKTAFYIVTAVKHNILQFLYL
jgi:hypothetical protein